MINDSPNQEKESLLTAEQHHALIAVLQDGAADEKAARCARIVLAADEGLPVSAIAAQVDLSPSGVRYWLKRFQADGMALFAGQADGAPGAGDTTPEPAEQAPADEALDTDEPSSVADDGAITLAALWERYSVDMVHAEHVAQLATQLFDATVAIHGYGTAERRLLEAAATSHNLAFKIDPANYHQLGRDILLAQPIVGFSKGECKVLACAVSFGRKKVKPHKEPLYDELKKSRQKQALALAALLRIANGLDYSYTQTCILTDVRQEAECLVVLVEGDYADLNAARAEKAADLWQRTFKIPFQIRERHPEVAMRADRIWPRLTPEVSMVRAGKILMEHYLMRVEQHTERLREGDDVLSLLERDLFRLKSLFTLFSTYYDATALAPFKKDARWLYRHVDQALAARACGALFPRDETIPAVDNTKLNPLFEGWAVEATRMLKRVNKAVDSSRYQQFLTGLLGFCRRGSVGVFPGVHNHVSVGTQAALQVWQVYADLRVVIEQETEATLRTQPVRQFHSILHYYGNLFADMESVVTVIQPIDAKLCDIQLGEVVCAAIPQVEGDKKRKKKRAVKADLDELLTWQQEWLAAAYAGMEPLWEAIMSPEFRRDLAQIIAEV